MNIIENIKYLRNFAHRHKIILILDDIRFRDGELWIGFKLEYICVNFIEYNPYDRKLLDAIPEKIEIYENYFGLKIENGNYKKAIKLLVKWVKNLEKLRKLEFPLKPLDITKGEGILYDGIIYEQKVDFDNKGMFEISEKEEKFLKDLGEAILNYFKNGIGTVNIDDVKRKDEGEGWYKISFWYKLEDEEDRMDANKITAEKPFGITPEDIFIPIPTIEKLISNFRMFSKA